MSVRSFFDTNILLYSDDASSERKRKAALEVIAEHRRRRTAVISIQVLQEYFAGLTKKFGVDALTARRKVELASDLDVVVLQQADVLAAVDLHRLHQLSIWDALIIRAAKQAGCRVLLSEDLQTGRDFDGVRIVNPFANQ